MWGPTSPVVGVILQWFEKGLWDGLVFAVRRGRYANCNR